MDKAQTLATQLGLPFLTNPEELEHHPHKLSLGVQGLSFISGKLSLRQDFVKQRTRLKHHNLSQELLVKAVRMKSLRADFEEFRVVDATAGLGDDALLLAAAGFSVTLFERNPIIAALLEDALARAVTHPELTEIIDRMQLIKQDSIEGLAHLPTLPTVVYLDPMFPARSKQADVKKKFQLLHELEPPCSDQADLLCAAQNSKPRKIVIKRPRTADCLAGIKPHYSVKGKTIRYDCLVFPATHNTK